MVGCCGELIMTVPDVDAIEQAKYDTKTVFVTECYCWHQNKGEIRQWILRRPEMACYYEQVYSQSSSLEKMKDINIQHPPSGCSRLLLKHFALLLVLSLLDISWGAVCTTSLNNIQPKTFEALEKLSALIRIWQLHKQLAVQKPLRVYEGYETQKLKSKLHLSLTQRTAADGQYTRAGCHRDNISIIYKVKTQFCKFYSCCETTEHKPHQTRVNYIIKVDFNWKV